jgi:hypothetical protein
MSERLTRERTGARVMHSTPGRIRVRIDAPRGQGRLQRLAEELNRMPDTRTVRANHTARSVTVTFDRQLCSAPTLLERLQELGMIALDLADPEEWAETLVEEVVPQAEDPTTLPGWFNRELLWASAGNLDLFRLTVGLLLLTAGMQLRAGLLRGEGIPWLRVLTYLLAAASIWTRHRERAGLPA